MPRKRDGSRHTTSVNLDIDLHKTVQKWCIDHDTSFSALVENLLKDLLEKDKKND